MSFRSAVCVLPPGSAARATRAARVTPAARAACTSRAPLRGI
jgi:hypothetical protein